ncbi:MAG: Rne/Rng family ribonuclease [Pseudomonadota bacterium]
MKRMLFNATQSEELRVAIVDGQKLIDLDIEHAGKEQRKSNIYKGIITRVEPSLEAVFLDYGSERHGFLPFKEIAKQYLQNEDGEFSRSRIAGLLREKQEIIVQVDKDERGNKGAALTTFISLAGRYLVLMPNNPRGGGVSRRVEGDDRAELRELMDQLEVPAGTSLIARTAGIGRTLEELQWDLNYLLQLWRAIENAAQTEPPPCLIYLESSLVVRAIRDLFTPDIGEILIDTPEIYEQARAFMTTVMPGNVHKVKLYRDDVPLFSRFQIEHQIETAYRRDVSLPSGGAIIIDHTEALVSIDVNSARATKGADIEQTALNTNVEAADEIARQLRLRDLGGLVVIDFIDMESTKNQREVENRLRDALRPDRARVQTGKISRFGLLELSRQRLQPSLGETSHIPCPRCSGTGHIRDTESSALHILRILQEEAMKENTASIHAQVPVDVATFLLNEKRSEIHSIESRLRVEIVLIPNIHLETPNYTVERIRSDSDKPDEHIPSYKLAAAPVENVNLWQPQQTKVEIPERPQPVVRGITPAQPAPLVAAREAALAEAPRASLITKIVAWFKGTQLESATTASTESKPAKRDHPRRERGERKDNRPRQDQDRQERSRRPEKPERDPAPKQERAPRPPKGERKERGDREPRPERQTRAAPQENRPEREIKPQEEAVQLLASQEAVIETPIGDEIRPEGTIGNGEAREGRSRRGRRGGRRERGDRPPRVHADTLQSADGTAVDVAANPPANEPAFAIEATHQPEFVFDTNSTASNKVDIDTTVETFAVVKSVQPAPVEEVRPISNAVEIEKAVVDNVPSFPRPHIVAAPPIQFIAATEEPQAKAFVQTKADELRIAQPAQTAAPEAAPVVDIKIDLAAAGLVMVETHPEKAMTLTPNNDQSSARPPRRVRERPSRSLEAEQLVQVETHNKQ